MAVGETMAVPVRFPFVTTPLLISTESALETFQDRVELLPLVIVEGLAVNEFTTGNKTSDVSTIMRPGKILGLVEIPKVSE